MTVEEFYQSTEFLELDKHDRKALMFTYYDLLDFAERFAEHLEKSALQIAATQLDGVPQ